MSAPHDRARDAALERWVAPSATSAIDQIELSEIHGGWRPGRVNELSVDAAVATIRAAGIIEPVLLRPRDAGGYELVTGHRMVEAARVAGLDRVPATVRALDDAQALQAMATDGSASGQLTPEGAHELRDRLRRAGAAEEAVEDVFAAVGMEVPAAGLAPPSQVEARAPVMPPVEAPVAAASQVEAPAAEAPVAEFPAAEAPAAEAPAAEFPAAEAPAAEAPAAEFPAAEAPAAEAPAAEAPAAEAPAAEALQLEAPPLPTRRPEAPVPPVPRIEAPTPAAAEHHPWEQPAASRPQAPPSRWIPLPAGTPRLARLSTAFADAPRMLRLLAADAFTGTVELTDAEQRRDFVFFARGSVLAVSVERSGRPASVPLRLPAPDRGPGVEITVRPHAEAIVVALALALRSPARFAGLDASFVDLRALLGVLERERASAACVVSAPRGSGAILLAEGRPVAAYARRRGELPGEEAETTDFEAVAELFAEGEGEVDVHDGPLPQALDLDEIIASAIPAG